MPYQTTYTETHAPAIEGQIATLYPYKLASAVVEAAAGIGFGKVCVIGATDRSAKVPDGAGANKFLGISVRTSAIDHQTTTDTDKYLRYSEVAYLPQGEVWVTVAENVNDGDPVFFNEVDGAFYKATATNYTQIAGAKYMTTATSGNLAKVRIN